MGRQGGKPSVCDSRSHGGVDVVFSASMDTTEHDLKLLSIGYFIQGGLGILSGLLSLGYLGVLGFVFSTVQNNPQFDPQNRIPQEFLYMMQAILVTVVLAMMAGGISMVYCGLALRKHQSRTFILVTAAANCLAIPYGTVLGVFTFLVLRRAAAKEMFTQTPRASGLVS
jgi:hypothetical protein